MAVVLTLLFLCNLLLFNQCFAEIRIPVVRKHHQRKLGEGIKRFHPDAKFLQLENTNNLSLYSKHSNDLYDYTELIYVAKVGLGTPPQYFDMDMDTGSSDFWVPGTSCLNNCTNCADVPQCVPKLEFEPTNSSSFVNVGDTFHLFYLKGSCIGTNATDTIKIGDAAVTKQTIGVVSSIGKAFMSQHMNGIFGLGYQESATFTYPIPLLNMVKQGVIDKPIFSVWMERVGGGSTKGNVGGELVFGSNPDTSRYTGAIYYQPVTQKKDWMMKMDGYSVGSDSMIPTSYKNAVSDTGTSFIIGPKVAVQYIVRNLPLAAIMDNFMLMKCSKRHSAPSINLYFGGKAFEITANEYLIDIGLKQGLCLVAIQAGSIGDDVDWILGDTWIRAWYHVFDMENNRIGLARAGVARVGCSRVVISVLILTAALSIWGASK